MKEFFVIGNQTSSSLSPLIFNHWFKKYLKKKPLIGVLGLNPHNAEYSRKSEEKLNIIPAIKLLRKQGIKIQGPLVADTVFIENYKKW